MKNRTTLPLLLVMGIVAAAQPLEAEDTPEAAADFDFPLFVRTVLQPTGGESPVATILRSPALEITLQPRLAFSWNDLQKGERKVGRWVFPGDKERGLYRLGLKFLNALSDMSMEDFLQLDLAIDPLDVILVLKSNDEKSVVFSFESPQTRAGQEIRFAIAAP